METKNNLEQKSEYKFIKITAKDRRFIEARTKYEVLLKDFKVFLYSQSMKNTNSQSSTSGRPGSYTDYLVRLFVIVNEQKDIEIDSLDFINELKLIQKDSKFVKYNKKEHRFPSSTIKDYFKYWNIKAFEEDDILDNLINELNTIKDKDASLREDLPVKKPSKVSRNNKKVYDRDLAVIKYSKNAAKWLCEFDSTHNTFISKSNNLPYIEAHHLIPMALQGNFDYSLDIPSNIVSLCPNCHRMIHYCKDKEIILESLYSKRVERLYNSGIKISRSELFLLYDIDN